MAQANKSAPKKPSIFARFGKYLKDVRTELRRVSWPSRTDVINSSAIVLITLLFFMAYTFIVDGISSYVFLDLIAGLFR